jgi:hypothetical protein
MFRQFPLLPAVAVLFLGLALGACTAAPPPKSDFAPISFAGKPSLQLDVGEIVVEIAYKAPNQPPNVEHLFPDKPVDAATRWAGERLIAAGPANRARYIVREASVTETRLKRKGGLTGALTTEQSERYDARVVVEIQIAGEADGSTGTATVQAERSITVPEDATLNERERTWHELTQKLMADLDAQLEQTVTTVFFRYLII